MPELEISRIHDAYETGGECPICDVMTLAESAYVHSFHGGRVMAPEVRVGTNRTGFCPAHLERLYRGEGKLGLGLMVHTHLEETVPDIRRRIQEAAGATGRRERRGEGALTTLAAALEESVARCYICDMLRFDLDRYCYTVLYLWQRDTAFPDRLRGSRGFCLPHYAALARKADTTLSHAERGRWMRDSAPLMVRSLERIEAEVFDFTQRYHHGAAAAGPGGQERTALSRAIQKLTGRPLRLERGIGAASDHDQDSLTMSPLKPPAGV